MGVRSPNGDSQGVIDSDPEPLFRHAAEVLNKHGVAWVELREPSRTSEFAGFGGTDQRPLHDAIREVFKGKLVLNQEYTRDAAMQAVARGTADAISFGRSYIANADLFEKLRDNVAIPPDSGNLVQWFYSQGPEGYTEFSSAKH